MGTSRARRAPTSKLWQRAKRAMTRFAAAPQADPAMAADVFAIYSLARQDSLAVSSPIPGSPMESLEAVAQRVADFYTLWGRYGLTLALKTLGWAERPPESAAPWPIRLVDTLAGAASDLEAAVARVSLLAALRQEFEEGAGERHPETAKKPSSAEVGGMIQEFIALALYHRVMSDLGESLEARAPDVNLGLARAGTLKSVIEQKVAAVMAEIPFDITWPQARRHDWVGRSFAALGTGGVGQNDG